MARQIAHAPRPHLGRAGMIEQLRPPRLANSRPHRRHRAAGLPCHDDQTNRHMLQVELVVGCDLRQMQAVARRGHKHRRPDGSRHFEPRERCHPPGGNRHHLPGEQRVETAPKACKGSERRGHEHSIARPHAAAVEDRLPARHPPCPVIGRVEDRHRPAVRAAGLVKSHVAIGRPGEVAGDAGRCGRFDQFFLEGEGPLFEGIERRQFVRLPCELPRIEAVVRQDRPHEPTQPLELERIELLTRRRR